MNNGGPAFPEFDGELHTAGMSLRDYFAAQIATGIVANRSTCGRCEGSDRRLAEISYHLADAMLAERERTAEWGEVKLEDTAK